MLVHSQLTTNGCCFPKCTFESRRYVLFNTSIHQLKIKRLMKRIQFKSAVVYYA